MRVIQIANDLLFCVMQLASFFTAIDLVNICRRCKEARYIRSTSLMQLAIFFKHNS